PRRDRRAGLLPWGGDVTLPRWGAATRAVGRQHRAHQPGTDRRSTPPAYFQSFLPSSVHPRHPRLQGAPPLRPAGAPCAAPNASGMAVAMSHCNARCAYGSRPVEQRLADSPWYTVISRTCCVLHRCIIRDARHGIVARGAGGRLCRHAQPSDGAPLAADLIGPRDRARLEALVAARAAHPAEAGYRIGPDDLLDVRIPDLLDVPPEA